MKRSHSDAVRGRRQVEARKLRTMAVRSTLGLVALLLLAGVRPASAQRLPTTVRPDHYDLHFVVDIAHARFDGTETIRVDVLQPTSRIVLNAADLRLHDAAVGRASSAQHATIALDEQSQQVTLTVPKRLERGRTEIAIHYAGTLNDQLRGFYLSRGRDRNYAVTQFESTDARRAFPSFDEPSFKATFAITVTIDQGDHAISNGHVVADVAGPAPMQHTVTFSTTLKMSTYLVAMAVGDFQCAEGGTEGIPIRVCATPDKKGLTGIALESAQQIMRFYNAWYAIKYPFGKLDILAVPDFAAGAMENTAAIFYRETDLLADSKSASVATRRNIASVLAHEMAHQWFGNLVTMAWWDDIWLNEGFATWMANKPLAALHPDWNIPVEEARETQTALNLDSLSSTRAIHHEAETPAQIDELFDAIAYEKGASVLRMIESFVGAEVFRTGVNAYLQAHAFGNATSEDLAKALGAASGKPIERILPTFVNQPGVPLVTVGLTCPPEGPAAVALSQQAFRLDATPAPRAQWQIPLCYRFADSRPSAGGVPACLVLSDLRGTIPVTGAACPRWVFANVGARGYYRTEYSPALVRAIAPDAQTQLAAPERLSLINDEWALMRARHHTVADYLTLAAEYGHERTNGVLADVTDHLGFVHDYLTTSANGGRFEGFVRDLFAPLYQELGFNGSPADTDERRELRATVVTTLGLVADDREVVSQARAALDRSLSGGAQLDATLEQAIVPVAAAHGDARLFDALVAAAARAVSPEETYRYLYALSDFREPALVDRALQLTLTPQIRSQDAALYLAHFFGNPAARDRAWSFLTTHWTDLEGKVTVSGGDVRIVSATSAFCDTASHDAVTAFFAAHPLPDAARTAAQALERITNCIALRDTQPPILAAWLDHR